MDMQQVPQGMGSGFIWDQKVRAARPPAHPAALLPSCLRTRTGAATVRLASVWNELCP